MLPSRSPLPGKWFQQLTSDRPDASSSETKPFYQPNAKFCRARFLRSNVNSARSNYTALQLQYRRPLSHGVQILASYTYSHSLDNASSDVIGATPGVIISGAGDYASSDFDVRHSFFELQCRLTCRLRAKAVWRPGITRDWSLQSVIVARSGFPFNAQSLWLFTGRLRAFRARIWFSGQPIWIKSAGAAGGRSLVKSRCVCCIPANGEARHGRPQRHCWFWTYTGGFVAWPALLDS